MNHASAPVKRLPLTEIALSVLLLVFAYLSPRFIPYNMDEFSHYHVLGCKFSPLNDTYNRFANGCDEYDLKLPGTASYLPLRSYIYIGVAQTVPFMAFWALFDDPVAGRVHGTVYLILVTYLLARLVAVKWRHALFAVLLLPAFCAPFILDTGPVGISLCALLAAMLLMRKAVTLGQASSQVGLGILIGLVTALAVSIKAVFFWVVPALVVWTLWMIRPQDNRSWLAAVTGRWPLLLSAAVTFAIPVIMLLAAVDRLGHPFIEVSSNGGMSLSPSAILYQIKRLGRLVMNGARFDFRTMRFAEQPVFEALPALIGVFILAAGLWFKQRRDRHLVLVLLLLGAMTFGIIATNARAWAPHHIVYALVFVVAALASCIGSFSFTGHRTLLLCLMGLSGMYWMSLAVRLPTAVIQTNMNFDKDRLTRFIHTSHLDAQTVQLHVDWGTYYLSHTFGDREQLVLSLYGSSSLSPADRRRDLEKMRGIAAGLHRDVLLIALQSSNMSHDPDIVATLGQPTTTYSFDTWMIARYRT